MEACARGKRDRFFRVTELATLRAVEGDVGLKSGG
jgi:hypothetical protein